MPNIIRIPSPVNNGGSVMYGLEFDPTKRGTLLYKLISDALIGFDLNDYLSALGTNWSNAFNSCSYITTLAVTGLDTSSVTSLNHTFYLCRGLTELDLSGWDTSSCTDFQMMIAQCPYLNKIWVPSTFVATAATTDAKKPFYYFTANSRTTHIYTDAADDTGLDWGTIHANYTVHYGATHADYENA